jgi:TetR/AcrR family fatty acid metabolism transcriptional regulator
MTAHSANDERSQAKEKGGDKHRRILTAAERVFAKRGFFAARVSEIAKEAGVADGTIYLYFKSKDDLLISLFETRMQQVNSVLREAVAAVPASRPSEQLRAFIRTYLKLVHDEPAAAEVLTIELRQSSKFMKEYDNPQFADFLRMLGGIVGACQQRGEIDPSIPSHVAARMIFGMLDELALAWVLARQPLRASTIATPSPGTKPKKFDIVRAADWVVAFVQPKETSP